MMNRATATVQTASASSADIIDRYKATTISVSGLVNLVMSRPKDPT